MSSKSWWLSLSRLVGLFLGLVLFFFISVSTTLATPVVVATVPVGTAPVGPAVNTTTNRFYITSITGNAVLVVDGNTKTLVATIPLAPLGNNPTGISVDSNTNRIYVATPSTNNVIVIDGATNAISAISGFSSSFDVAVNSSIQRLYVTNTALNTVSVLNSTNNALITTVAVGSAPNWIRLNSITNRVYIGNSGSGTISVLDGNSNTVIGTIPYPYLGIDDVNNLLYVTSGSIITILDGTTNAVVRTVNVGIPTLYNVKAIPQLNRVYGVDFANNRVIVWDSTTYAVIATLTVGLNPGANEYNPNSRQFLVANQSSGSVSIIADITPPTISKAFGAASISYNGTTSLSFTITNTNALEPLTGVTFTDVMPAGLVVATNPNITSTCGGTLTAVAGSSTIQLTGGTLAVAGNCTIKLDVTGTTPGVKNNTTQPISSTLSGPGLPSNTATLIVNPSADVALKKTVDNAKPNVGTNVVFTINATNNGPSDATTLVITDILPAGLTFVSNSIPSLGTVTVNGSTVSWTIPTLANAASTNLQITAQVMQSGVIINTATKTQTEPDPVSINNQSSIGLNAPTVDLQIQKSVTSSNLSLGEIVTFTVGVTNLGPDNATGVKVKDLLPAGLEYVSSVAPVGTTYQSATGDWTIGNLNNGQQASLQLSAKTTQTGSITNTALKSGEDQYDFNPLNDAASVTLTVAAVPVAGRGRVYPADLVAQLRVTPDRLALSEPSNLISYTFTIKNIGAGRATQTSIRFPLDPNLAIGYTNFGDGRMWVSAIVTMTDQPYIQIKLPTLEAKQIMTGTVVFRPATSAPTNATIFTRYIVGWDDALAAGKQAGSNAVRYNLNKEGANRDETGGAVQFFDPASSSIANNTPFKFNADFYAPHELVTFWYTDKKGVSVALGTQQADDQGKMSFEFTAKDLIVGDSYVIAGMGNRSEVTGSIVVTIT